MNLQKYHKEAIVRALKLEMPFKYTAEDVQKMAYKAMSKWCQARFRSHPGALRTFYVTVNRRSTEIVIGDAPETWIDELAEYRALRDKTLANLEAAIHGCRTRKQFVDSFPEFSHHAPAEEAKCGTLPAISNVVADMVKLGWNQKVFKGENK